MGIFNKKQSAQDNSAASLINRFVSKSEGLQRILEKETEYFKDMKIKQAEILMDSKTSLIEELSELKSSLIKDQSLLKNIPEAEKRKLRAANNNLMKAAEDNYNETLKAKEVNRIILEAISDALSQTKKVEGAYGEDGGSFDDYGSSPITVLKNV